MTKTRTEYIVLYDRYIQLDNFDFSHDELSKIVIGCFTKNNQDLQDLEQENVLFEILDIMCMKLLTIPKFTLHIRMAMENLESIKELLSDKKVGICDVITIFFTKDEISACIF
jgi:hypothetical protein